jgi:hypothetical protein
MAIQNRAGEVQLTFKPADSPCALELRASGASTPLFAMQYEGSKIAPIVTIGDKKLPLHPGSNGVSTIHLWMDGSVIEVFLDSREAMTARNFTPSSGGIEVAWTGAATLESISVSEVEPISPDRLTS